MPDDAPWYVVAVEPQAERKVEARAHSLAIEAYVPTGRHQRIASRKRTRGTRTVIEVDRPAMPGYVFVRGELRFCQFGRVLEEADSVAHCVGFLSGPDGPEPVKPEAVEEIRRRQAEGAFDAHVKIGRHAVPRWVQPGARVRIVEGPLRGACGEIWRTTRNRKVALWLTMMGRPTLTEIDLDWVARAR